MRQMRWMSGLAAGTLTLLSVGAASAEVTSDRAAAILRWPLVSVATFLNNEDDAILADTALEVTNVTQDPVDLHCFYENANSHCTLDGSVCTPGDPDTCELGGFFGVCLPGWNETDFRIRLTPRQPLGWNASEGLADFPIDGLIRVGSDGSSNAGSRIPPVAERPFDGSLLCLVTDDNGNPIDRNAIKGTGAFALAEVDGDGTEEVERINVLKYNAIGNEAYEGAVNDDNTLVLGRQDDGAEYQGCPNVTILNHFFDGVEHPINEEEVNSFLLTVPCSVDFLRQDPAGAIVQYLVYNEFEQRFSTSRGFRCWDLVQLSNIDTVQNERSIFNAAVSGTTVGQTRARTIGAGMQALLLERITEPDDFLDHSAAVNVHFQGDREGTDAIVIP